MDYKITVLLLAAFLVSGCKTPDATTGGSFATVFDSRFLVACGFPENISFHDSVEQLTQLGVDRHESGCAVMTNISMTESCADLSGEFYLHQIRRVNLADIEETPYRSITELKTYPFPDRYAVGEEGGSFVKTDCSDATQ